MIVRSVSLLMVLGLTIAVEASDSIAGKSEWRQLRTSNFNVIGNTTEKEMVRVADRLERFRGAFGQMFRRLHVVSPVQTHVVVFKNDSSFRLFKPLRPDGKIDEMVAGYFQSGEEANYVVLSVGRTEAETFRTVFHEYIHFLVNANARGASIPAWFNEGLAEYYQSFSMVGERKAIVGTPNRAVLDVLKRNRLLAPDDFFGTTNGELRSLGNHSRSIFYAQAWATMHYLVNRKKRESLDRYIELTMKGRSGEEPFKEVFGATYSEMATELQRYIETGNLNGTIIDMEPSIMPIARGEVKRLAENQVNAYLGDLLFRTGREAEAEGYLKAALSENPGQTIANTSMGIMRMRQNRLPEARPYLERAVGSGSNNYIGLYQLAFLLSQESKGEFGFVSSFPEGSADRMRDLLRRAIELNPDFAESYELFAFVCLVSNEHIDEAIDGIIKAIERKPGEGRFVIRLAELYLRKDRFTDAMRVATDAEEKVEDIRIRQLASSMIERIKTMASIVKATDDPAVRSEGLIRKDSGFESVADFRSTADTKEPNPEEVERKVRELYFQAISKHLRKAAENEVQIVGRLERIDCKGGRIEYSAMAEGKLMLFTSKDFQVVYLTSYVTDAGMAELGCGVRPAVPNAVLTYVPGKTAGGRFQGMLVSVEFVPTNFKSIEP